MKKLVLFLLIATVAFPAMAAEFEYKGENVRSEVKREIFDCGTYSIAIETDGFPFKYEGRIPNSLMLDGFMGIDTIVSVNAIYEGQTSKVIPSLTELFTNSDVILEGRFYIPTKAKKANGGVAISYWAGGNCDYCEAFVYFEFEADGQIKKAELLTYSRYRELTE